MTQPVGEVVCIVYAVGVIIAGKAISDEGPLDDRLVGARRLRYSCTKGVGRTAVR